MKYGNNIYSKKLCTLQSTKTTNSPMNSNTPTKLTKINTPRLNKSPKVTTLDSKTPMKPPKAPPLDSNEPTISKNIPTQLQSPHQVSKNHTILTKIHAFDKKRPITCLKSSPLPYFLLLYPNQNTNKTDENMDQITPLLYNSYK